MELTGLSIQNGPKTADLCGFHAYLASCDKEKLPTVFRWLGHVGETAPARLTHTGEG